MIPPSPTYSNGRFSNGPIWVDYLASDLGLTLNLKNNFAFGGATTGTENIGLPSLPACSFATETQNTQLNKHLITIQLNCVLSL